MFHYFLSGYSKQYAATTTAHTKHLISLLKEKKILTTSLSKIWENNDGCDEQFRYASALYFMSVMSQCYSVIIDWGISAPRHVKYVVDVINAVDKSYIYQLVSNIHLPGSNRFYSQMKIHTGNQKYDVSLAQEF